MENTAEDAEAEEASDGLELYNWVSTKILDAKAEGTWWRLESAEECSVCSKILQKEMGFFFYGRLMDTMGIRIPLTDFQQRVLDYLRLAPSKLVPNAWGYVRTFELAMEYMGRSLFVRFFLPSSTCFKGRSKIQMDCDRTMLVFVVPEAGLISYLSTIPTSESSPCSSLLKP